MWPIASIPEDDRGTDTGNMHKNYVKIACVVPEIFADRQTNRQTCSSQYFATAPAGEVIIECWSRDILSETETLANTQVHCQVMRQAKAIYSTVARANSGEFCLSQLQRTQETYIGVTYCRCKAGSGSSTVPSYLRPRSPHGANRL